MPERSDDQAPVRLASGLDARAFARRAARLDAESRDFIRRLSGHGHTREAALRELHSILLGVARHEVNRRRATGQLRSGDFEDLALQSADDAVVAILARLDDFRGESRFSTWAYKFAIFEVGAKVRQHTKRGRETPLGPLAWEVVPDRTASPQQQVEEHEFRAAIKSALLTLSPRQRDVLIAVALRGVRIDQLAEQEGISRTAIYDALYDARGHMRAELSRLGFALDSNSAPLLRTATGPSPRRSRDSTAA